VVKFIGREVIIVNNYESLLNPIRNPKLADYTYEVIRDYIQEFESELDNEHEIAVQLASFGKNITMAVTDIGYTNPSTIVFYGYVDNQKATLIQHISQLSFLLLSVTKQDPENPPRRIGFEPATVD
jgi:hypothetical protein